MLGDRLAPSLYQDCLIERGWRRSGRALYKPDNWTSCCPALALRLPVAQYDPTKKQRKLLRDVESVFRPSSSAAAAAAAASVPLSRAPSKGGHQAINHARLLQSLEQSGVLSQLVDVTRQCLVKCLPPHTLASWEIPPIAFKLHPAKKQRVAVVRPPLPSISEGDRSHPVAAEDETTTVVVLSTSICAAVAGRLRSSGVPTPADSPDEALAHDLTTPATVDRASLAELLAIALQERFASSPLVLEGRPPNERPVTATQGVFRVVSHPPSGQVLVHLNIDPLLSQRHGSSERASEASTRQTTSQSATKEMADSQMNADSVSAPPLSPPPPTPPLPRNKFAEWWIQQATQGASPPQPDAHQPPGVLCLPAETPPPPPYELTIHTLTAHESALDPLVHQLYCRYQHAVHGDPDPFNFSVGNGHGTVSSTTTRVTEEVKTKEAPVDDGKALDFSWGDKAPAEWLSKAKAVLHATYGSLSQAQQFTVVESYGHYYEFLVENPFVPVDSLRTASSFSASPTRNSLPPGAYHQHYKIGDLLVAVGVVDVLPRGLSSVYLFYEPTFARDVIPLGKYAILKEIQFARDTLQVPYYYLGYYIESCPKMRYKAEYRPSELLCPATLRWVDAVVGQKTLIRDSPERHCCRLAPVQEGDGDEGAVEQQQQPPPAQSTDDGVLSRIPLEVGVGRHVTFQMLTPPGQALLRPYLQEFVSHVGPDVAVQCTLTFR